MNLEEIAKLSGDDPFRAQQKWTELRDFLEFLKDRKISNVLEVGVYKGGTLMAWTHVATPDAKLLGVDLPEGEFGGGFTEQEATGITGLARENQEITLIAADSHEPAIIERIAEFAPFDFMFIDGDHTYEGVKQDFENFFPMLKKGGVISFHDIVDHSTNKAVQVQEFWKEIKDQYEHYEFTDPDFPSDWNPWGGIGAIVK